MKTYYRGYLICLTLSLVVATSYTQWMQTNGPYGGEITCLERNGTSIFAGTEYGGVYLSTDNGANWATVNTGLTSLSIYTLTASGTNLFAGTDGGVFLSTNNGTSWVAVNSGLTGLSVLAITPKDANLFAGVWNKGVFLSTNNGTSWAPVNNGLTTFLIRTLAVHGSSLFAGTAGSGVFLSTDDGATWIPANTGIPTAYVYAFASIDTNLFAAVFGGFGVYRWTNSDSSWVAVGSGLTSTYTFDLAASGTTLFAGMTNGGGVFRSTNFGANWTPAMTGLKNRNVQSILVDGVNLFAGTRGGVFLSTDGGANWNFSSTGLANTGVTGLAVSGSKLFAAAGFSGLYHSTDNGINWSEADPGLLDISTYSILTYGSRLVAATNAGVYSSTNEGTSWEMFLSGNWYAFLVSGSTFYAGSTSGVIYTTDNGANWTWANTGLTNTNIQTFALKDTILFAGTWGGGVFLTTDNGANWTAASSGLTQLEVLALAVSGQKIFAGTWGGGIFLSTDNGTSWSTANTGLTNLRVKKFAVSGTSVFAGTNGGGIFLSTNGGASWTAVNNDLTSLKIEAMLVAGSNLFVGVTAGGAWSAPLQSLVPPLLGEYPSDVNTALLLHMNETGGSSVADASSNANDGTATGTTIVDGRFGKARNFNGTSDYVSVPNSSSLNPASALTVEAWFKTPTSATQPILSKYDYYSGQASSLGFLITKNQFGRLKFVVGSGTSELAINGTKNVYDDKWHHVAGVYDGTNLRLYLDGQLDSMKTASGALNQTSLDVLIGAVRYYGIIQYEWFSGLIDEVRISDVARQPNEFNLQLPPKNLTATPSGNTSIELSWENGGGMAPLMKYRIYRNIDSTDATLRDSTTAASYINTGLTPGTRYFFRVSAVDSTGFEGSRSYTVGCVAGDVTAPSSPQNLVATDSSSGTITVKWRKNGESDFLRYRIYRGTSPAPTVKVDSTSAGSTDTSKTFTGLANGTRYYFRVTAVDSVGNESGYSNEVNAMPADRLAPAAPVGLVVTDSSSTMITIKWRKSSEPDFLRYRIYRGTSTSPTTKVDSTSAGSTDTSKTFTGLADGTRYYFRVTAADTVGNESGYSNEVNAMPADRLAPAAPTNLVVTDSSSTTITIKWRKNTESDFLRYRIYRGTLANPTTKVDSTTAGAADTSKTFTGLTNGTRYYLSVTAVDSSANESPYSNEVNAAPNFPSGVDELLSQIPKDFSLAQNYPNPFNPTTVIRYGVPVRSHVRLEIFNMLGQRVAVLADEEQEARYYERTWEGSGASGLYFYRLQAVASDDANRKYADVKKMLLVK